MVYDNTPTVCVGIVPCDNGLLMIRRALKDGKGKLALPGGFQVRPDTLEETASREIKEETGVIIKPEDWMLVSVETVPNRSVNLAFYMSHYHAPLQEFTHDDEIEEVLIIREPVETAFPLHTKWVNNYFNMIAGVYA